MLLTTVSDYSVKLEGLFSFLPLLPPTPPFFFKPANQIVTWFLKNQIILLTRLSIVLVSD